MRTKMKTINLGCGEQFFGDTRVDFVKTKSTTHVFDLNNDFPLENESYDEIYCNSVLEHIGNVRNFLKESKRILKKGGKFYFRTDNANYIGFQLQNHQSYLQKEDWSKNDKHYYLFKPEHLINFFGKDIEIKYPCPSKKLFFLPKKFKCMHLEVRGEQK